MSSEVLVAGNVGNLLASPSNRRLVARFRQQGVVRAIPRVVATRFSALGHRPMELLLGNSVADRRQATIEFLGFREGAASVHTSRTMMLAELTLLLEHVGRNAKVEEYLAAIVDHNVLGKPTQTTRKRSAQRLAELYALDQSRAVFRL